MYSFHNLSEDEDAQTTAALVRKAGRHAVRVRGDLADAGHCREVIDTAVAEFGHIDILVNNAAHQRSFEHLDEISDEEWDRTFQVNIHAMFRLCKAALPHMRAGSSIINTTSINADSPNPTLLPYATSKGAIQNFTAGLAQLLAKQGIRANCVAPGPIWTPLIPSTLPPDAVKKFGEQVPMQRPGQPAELASAFVMLADPRSSLCVRRHHRRHRRPTDDLIDRVCRPRTTQPQRVGRRPASELFKGR